MYRQIFGKDQMRNSYIGQKGIMKQDMTNN